MTPREIVERSLQKGLDFVAVCDHNSAENTAAAVRYGRQRGLWVLAGLEINSREEVHTLAIFEEAERALEMQAVVYRQLRGTNRPEIFGDQVVVNEFDEVEGFNDRMLIGATRLALHELIAEIHRLGGVSISSHVDRPSYSILSQLGFIPPDLAVDALEISGNADQAVLAGLAPEVNRLPVLSSSDAHFPNDIGKASTSFLMRSLSWSEFRMALAGKDGRGVKTD
jgi:predicted metal-dependent phosphoesterase TrpH